MDKRIAAVTGSYRGIGLAIVKALVRSGYKTIVSDVLKEDEASSVLSEINSEGDAAQYIRCDISRSGDRQYFFEVIKEKYGRLDVLVNNAGVAPAKRMDILETTEDSVDRLININLKGTFFMCQGAANLMIAMKSHVVPDYSPRIINIASLSSYTSSTNRGEYCISKAGVSMATMLFADKLAEYGIPVFEVRPGIILTDMTEPVREKYEKLIADGITPIRRFGRPEDVADCVMAAVSGNLDFATGQVLNADGGFHIRRL